MDKKLGEEWIRNQKKDGLETRRRMGQKLEEVVEKLGEEWIRNLEKVGLETRRRMDQKLGEGWMMKG